MPIQLSRIRGITISLIFFFFFLQLERIEEIVTEYSYLVYRFNARNNRILSRLKDITQKRGGNTRWKASDKYRRLDA